jgi:phosphoglycolate phosphatase
MPGYRTIAADPSRGDTALAVRMLAATGLDPVTGRARPGFGARPGAMPDCFTSGRRSPMSARRIHRRTSRCLVRRTSAVVPVPVTDLSALLGRLKTRGLRLGVATMDSHAAAVRSANEFAFHHHLDFIAGYDSGHGHKPGPGMMAAFCTAVAIEPRHVAVVGDTPHDMGMARSAGAGLAIGVLTGASPRFELEALADHILDSIGDLEVALGLARRHDGGTPSPCTRS